MPDSVILWTIAHQAPLSMGFSRQEYWSGLSCPLPGGLPNPGIKLSSLNICIGSCVLYLQRHLLCLLYINKCIYKYIYAVGHGSHSKLLYEWIDICRTITTTTKKPQMSAFPLLRWKKIAKAWQKIPRSPDLIQYVYITKPC